MTTLTRATQRWLPLFYVFLAVTLIVTISITFAGQ